VDGGLLDGVCSSDIEAMRTQLRILNAEVSKHRKAAMLWKKRYEQEKTARYGTVIVTLYVSMPGSIITIYNYYQLTNSSNFYLEHTRIRE